MSIVVLAKGDKPEEMATKCLDKLSVKPYSKRVVIKPNLITNKPYPVTTSVKTVEAIVEYYRGYEVIVAEGSGWCDTFDAFRDLGYLELQEKYGIKLVDLNIDEFKIKRSPNAFVWKELEVPLTLENCYLISAAVLKKHSICGVTFSVKNMLGATLGRDKGRFHRLGIDQSIVDVNIYRKPDLAIIDGRKGLESELGGKAKDFNIMIASEDPVAADAVGAAILGYKPTSIRHLKLAQEKGLGIADLNKIRIIKVE